MNIAGGMHGLDSWLCTGYANPYATTCDSQNWYDAYWFGFFPDSWSPSINPWIGTRARYAFANSGLQHTARSFYAIYAGTHDEVHCTMVSDYSNCGKGPLLKANTYVKAQLNVGTGSNAQQIDWSWSDYRMFNLMGGDTNGVGHFHAKSNTGQVIVNMLNTACSGAGCAAGYAYGPVQ